MQTETNLNRHIKSIHRSYVCNNCNAHFNNRIEYAAHVRLCKNIGLPMSPVNQEFFED